MCDPMKMSIRAAGRSDIADAHILPFTNVDSRVK